MKSRSRGKSTFKDDQTHRAKNRQRLPQKALIVLSKKMQTVLKKIKRMIIQKQYVFTMKAETEMFRDGLTETDVLESILNANGIKKAMRSKNPDTNKREKLYVIESFTYDGLFIYTKGKILKNERGVESLYVLISSKHSTLL